MQQTNMLEVNFNICLCNADEWNKKGWRAAGVISKEVLPHSNGYNVLNSCSNDWLKSGSFSCSQVSCHLKAFRKSTSLLTKRMWMDSCNVLCCVGIYDWMYNPFQPSVTVGKTSKTFSFLLDWQSSPPTTIT